MFKKNGRARIFNLINQKFRPTVCNFPSNILSPSDSLFVKKSDEMIIRIPTIYLYNKSQIHIKSFRFKKLL